MARHPTCEADWRSLQQIEAETTTPIVDQHASTIMPIAHNSAVPSQAPLLVMA